MKRYWMRIRKFQGGLIVEDNGIFTDKDSCEECGHRCFEVTEELGRTADPNDIKGRVVEDVDDKKVSKLSQAKAAVDLD